MNEMPTGETPENETPENTPDIGPLRTEFDERWARPVRAAIEKAQQRGGAALLRLTAAHCKRMTGRDGVPLTVLDLPCDPITRNMHVVCGDDTKIIIASPWF